MDTTPAEPISVRSITEFVDELVIGLINSRIYWSEHPRVLDCVLELKRMLPQFTSASTEDVLRIAIADDHFVYRQRPLLGASLSAPRLITAITSRASGGLEFSADAGDEDFQKLFEMLSLAAIAGETHVDVNERLKERGCLQIRLLPPYRPEHSKTGLRSLTAAQSCADDVPRSLVPVQLYQSVVNVLQDTTVSICHGGVIRFDAAQESIERVLHNLEQDAASLFGLSRYERYDAFTFGHSIRVALLALQLARSLTDDRDLLNRVGVAALLHDVGKAHVPFEVLHCKTRLSPEQRVEMQKHPTYGAEILLDHRDCDPMAYTAAFGHHITTTGSGYPATLHEQRLSAVTKIVKICDVYEALTAVRPYKPAMSSIRAFRIMMSMRGAFDLGLLRRFIEIMGAYPNGSLIRLDSGEIAQVRQQTSRIELPTVELVTCPDGVLMSQGDRVMLDLSRPEQAQPRCIAEMLVDAKLEDFAMTNAT